MTHVEKRQSEICTCNVSYSMHFSIEKCVALKYYVEVM